MPQASSLPFPSHLIFEVTTGCNHECLHCYNFWKAETRHPDRGLGTQETLRLLDRVLAQSGVRHLTLTGGEPLLRPDLCELVDHLHGRGIALNLISNGTLLTDEKLDRLCPNKIAIYELPLLGVERGVHDAMSGSPGAFDKVTRAIAELKLRKQMVVAVFVATRRNTPRLWQTLELALALGCNGVMLNRFNPGGRGLRHREELELGPSELLGALDQAESFARRYGFGVSCSIPMPQCIFDWSRYQELTFGHCAVGTRQAYMTFDDRGRVRPCNHSSHVVGDLTKQSFSEILASSELREFVCATAVECRGCRLELTCQGGCKAAAHACHGSLVKLDPWIARHRRGTIG